MPGAAPGNSVLDMTGNVGSFAGFAHTFDSANPAEWVSQDWSAYEAPEMLPNGDIIIRRKPDHPLTPPETPTEPAPQIEL